MAQHKCPGRGCSTRIGDREKLCRRCMGRLSSRSRLAVERASSDSALNAALADATWYSSGIDTGYSGSSSSYDSGSSSSSSSYDSGSSSSGSCD